MLMPKLRAFLIHLGISLTIVGAVVALVFFAWYPDFYFQVKGTGSVLRVLIGIDLVIGPLLTLLVYKPNKPGLRFDLATIAVLQLTALVYGTVTLFEERPYFTVFAVDRFEVLARKDVDMSGISNDQLTDKPFAGPITAVATIPEDIDEQQKFLNSVVFENQPDLERRPEYWSPYAEQAEQVLARAGSIETLRRNRSVAGKHLDGLLQKIDKRDDQLGFLPLFSVKGDFVMIIDRDNGMPIDAFAVDTWIEADGSGQTVQAESLREPSASQL